MSHSSTDRTEGSKFTASHPSQDLGPKYLPLLLGLGPKNRHNAEARSHARLLHWCQPCTAIAGPKKKQQEIVSNEIPLSAWDKEKRVCILYTTVFVTDLVGPVWIWIMKGFVHTFCTISRCPWLAAKCRGVSSPRFITLIRAPRMINISTTAERPSRQAQCKGEKPWSSLWERANGH